jgi:hypothetical protein
MATLSQLQERRKRRTGTGSSRCRRIFKLQYRNKSEVGFGTVQCSGSSNRGIRSCHVLYLNKKNSSFFLIDLG